MVTKRKDIFYYDGLVKDCETCGTKVMGFDKSDFDAYARMLGRSIEIDREGAKYFMINDTKIKRL